MKREDKDLFVEELRQSLQDVTGMVLADFTGLDVPTMRELRQRCRGEDISFRVVKNTLARRAFSKAGFEQVGPFLTGPTALAYSRADALAPARVLRRFREEHGRPEFKIGFIEGRILSAAEVAVAAMLPPRDELLSKALAALQSPVRGLVNVLSEPMRGLLRVLSRVAEATADRGEEETQ